MVKGISKSDGKFGGSPSPVVEPLPSTTNTQKFIFYIHPSAGFTGRLRKQCLSRSEPVPLKLLLEGPYGRSFSSHTYDALVLVAGGGGIAGILLYLRTYRKG